jgi:hypothetical protein
MSTLSGEQQAFQDQLNQRTAEHKQAEAEASATRMQEDYASWLRQCDPALNARSPYAGDPAKFETVRNAQLGVMLRAGVKPAVVKSPEEMAREQMTFSLPDEINPAFQAALDKQAARIGTLTHAQQEEMAKSLRESLAPGVYDRLVSEAKMYRPNLSRAELASQQVLSVYAGQARYNQAKRTGGKR